MERRERQLGRCRQWNEGLPGGDNDVTINTGSDNVTLNVSASINSLVLGGAIGFSELSDSGAQTLTIANDLTVGSGGYMSFTGGTTVTVGGNASNAYYVLLYNGSTLSVAGDFTNNYVAEASMARLSSTSGARSPTTWTFTKKAGRPLSGSW